MIVYKFRESDRAYDGPVELPDSPSIPPYHTFQAPPEQEGYWPFMRNGWVLVAGNKPSEPVVGVQAQVEALVRQERTNLLAATDWTQGKDISETVSAPWAVYRQALRDLPLQEGFPFNIEWPQRPE